MSKGQKRSNREIKKPKQPKSEKKPAASALPVATARELLRGQKDRVSARR